MLSGASVATQISEPLLRIDAAAKPPHTIPPVAPWTNGASQAAERDFFTTYPGSTAVPAASASSPTSPISWFCRFLRAEIEEEKLAAAAGRRHLLKLERQVA